MNRREAAVISAYTGILIGNFADLQDYADEIFDRPTFTHEFALDEFADYLKSKSKDEFVAIMDDLQRQMDGEK